MSDRRSPSCLDSCPRPQASPLLPDTVGITWTSATVPHARGGGGAVLLSQDSAGEGPGKQSVARAGPLSQRARWLWRGWGSRTPRRPCACWTGPGSAAVSPVYIELIESSVRVLCACAPAACVYVCECVCRGGWPGPPGPPGACCPFGGGAGTARPACPTPTPTPWPFIPSHPRSHCSLLFTNPHSPG